eukprot:TRINITY_DN13766_c0_g1_i1.p1 TRINITY_DN13766_c0_g1~~TRINITY_DN13766_c0_g1_i1.p1  ORF type:complete len:1018 (-),score=268.20 TRINITY_DN13766_c0_g1_i1:23-3076(-)
MKNQSLSLKLKRNKSLLSNRRLSSLFSRKDVDIQKYYEKIDYEKIDGVEFKSKSSRENDHPTIDRATFKRICEWIIWSDYNFKRYYRYMIFTFRTWSTPDSLFNLLQELYNNANRFIYGEVDESEIKNRLFLFLKEWVMIDDHFTTTIFFDLIVHFCSTHFSSNETNQIKLILLKHQERPEFSNFQKIFVNIKPCPNVEIILSEYNNFNILEIDSNVIAHHMTFIDYRFFSGFSSLELNNKNWQKKNKSMAAPYVSANIKRFNQFSYYISSTILILDSPVTQIKMLEKWIKIARECYKLFNYCGMNQVLTGITNINLQRLPYLWKGISSNRKSDLDFMENIMSMEKNFKNYRQDILKKGYHNCLPYMPIHLKDLYMIQEQNLMKRDENSMIILEEMSSMGKIIESILECKKYSTNHLKTEKNLLYTLRNVQFLTEEALQDLSKKLLLKEYDSINKVNDTKEEIIISGESIPKLKFEYKKQISSEKLKAQIFEGFILVTFNFKDVVCVSTIKVNSTLRDLLKKIKRIITPNPVKIIHHSLDGSIYQIRSTYDLELIITSNIHFLLHIYDYDPKITDQPQVITSPQLISTSLSTNSYSNLLNLQSNSSIPTSFSSHNLVGLSSGGTSSLGSTPPLHSSMTNINNLGIYSTVNPNVVFKNSKSTSPKAKNILNKNNPFISVSQGNSPVIGSPLQSTSPLQSNSPLRNSSCVPLSTSPTIGRLPIPISGSPSKNGSFLTQSNSIPIKSGSPGNTKSNKQPKLAKRNSSGNNSVTFGNKIINRWNSEEKKKKYNSESNIFAKHGGLNNISIDNPLDFEESTTTTENKSTSPNNNNNNNENFLYDEESYFETSKKVISPYLTASSSSYDTPLSLYSTPGSLPETFEKKKVIKTSGSSEETPKIQSAKKFSTMKKKSQSNPTSPKNSIIEKEQRDKQPHQIIYICFIFNTSEKFFPVSVHSKLKDLERIISVEYQKKMTLRLPESDYFLKTTSDFQKIVQNSLTDFIRLEAVAEKKKKKKILFN